MRTPSDPKLVAEKAGREMGYDDGVRLFTARVGGTFPSHVPYKGVVRRLRSADGRRALWRWPLLRIFQTLHHLSHFARVSSV